MKKWKLYAIGLIVLLIGMNYIYYLDTGTYNFFNKSDAKAEFVPARQYTVDDDIVELYENEEYYVIIDKVNLEAQNGEVSDISSDYYGKAALALFEQGDKFYLKYTHKEVNKDLMNEQDRETISANVRKLLHEQRNEATKNDPPPKSESKQELEEQERQFKENCKVGLGSTDYEVIECLGEPNDKTSTVSVDGTSEIWFYDGTTIYFDNHYVESFTNH